MDPVAPPGSTPQTGRHVDGPSQALLPEKYVSANVSPVSPGKLLCAAVPSEPEPNFPYGSEQINNCI